MKAVKANKEYAITEAEKKGYIDQGFDIIGNDGDVVAYGRGKTVPYADYKALQEENEKLKQELESFKSKTKKSTKEDTKQEDSESK